MPRKRRKPTNVKKAKSKSSESFEALSSTFFNDITQQDKSSNCGDNKYDNYSKTKNYNSKTSALATLETTDFFDTDFKVQSKYYTSKEFEQELVHLNRALTDPSKNIHVLASLREVIEHCDDHLYNNHFNFWFNHLHQLIVMHHADEAEPITVMSGLIDRPPASYNSLLLAHQLNQLTNKAAAINSNKFGNNGGDSNNNNKNNDNSNNSNNNSNNNNNNKRKHPSEYEALVCSKLVLFSVCLSNFPSCLLPSKVKMEKFCWYHIDSPSSAVQKAAAGVLASVQRVGGGGAWNQLIRYALEQACDVHVRIMNIKSAHLTNQQADLPQDSKNSCVDFFDQSRSSDLTYLLNRFSGLVEVVRSLISHPFPSFVNLPIDDVINLITTILNHKLKVGRGGDGHSHHLHHLSLLLLQDLVCCCTHKLVIHSELFHDYLLQSLIQSRASNHAHLFFPVLRTRVYSCLKHLWSHNLLPPSVAILKSLVDVAMLDLKKSEPLFEIASKDCSQNKFMSVISETYRRGRKQRTNSKLNDLVSEKIDSIGQPKIRPTNQGIEMYVAILNALSNLATCDFSALITSLNHTSRNLGYDSFGGDSRGGASMRLQNRSPVEVVMKEPWDFVVAMTTKRLKCIQSGSSIFQVPPTIVHSCYQLLTAILAIPIFRRSRMCPQALKLIWGASEFEVDVEVRQICKLSFHLLNASIGDQVSAGGHDYDSHNAGGHDYDIHNAGGHDYDIHNAGGHDYDIHNAFYDRHNNNNISNNINNNNVNNNNNNVNNNNINNNDDDNINNNEDSLSTFVNDSKVGDYNVRDGVDNNKNNNKDNNNDESDNKNDNNMVIERGINEMMMRDDEGCINDTLDDENDDDTMENDDEKFEEVKKRKLGDDGDEGDDDDDGVDDIKKLKSDVISEIVQDDKCIIDKANENKRDDTIQVDSIDDKEDEVGDDNDSVKSDHSSGDDDGKDTRGCEQVSDDMKLRFESFAEAFRDDL